MKVRDSGMLEEMYAAVLIAGESSTGNGGLPVLGFTSRNLRKAVATLILAVERSAANNLGPSLLAPLALCY